MFEFMKRKRMVEIYSPCKGEVIPIEKIEDEVFSKKMIGDGVAITPKDDLIYAPFDGEIVQVFETKHAIVLKDKFENNILIHIGLDTVKLGGIPFEISVLEGDKVRRGDIIAKVDFEFILKSNLDTTIIFVLLDDSGEKVIYDKNFKANILVSDKIFKIK